MLVEDIMTPKEKAVTIDPMTSVRKALELMREKKIKSIIVEKNSPDGAYGLLTFKNILQSMDSRLKQVVEFRLPRNRENPPMLGFGLAFRDPRPVDVGHHHHAREHRSGPRRRCRNPHHALTSGRVERRGGGCRLSEPLRPIDGVFGALHNVG